MSKHTQGPWIAAKTHRSYTDEYLRNKVWGPKGPGYGTICSTSRTSEGHADAVAIAALPDMLAALYAMCSAFDCSTLMDYEREAVEEAKAAIAKATGGGS